MELFMIIKKLINRNIYNRNIIKLRVMR
jgi:hypothetical protein